MQFQPERELDALFKHRLSAEMRPSDNVYSLTSNREAIKQDIKAARDGDRWPHQQLLWPLHPALQWLDLKLISLIGRQKAPVIAVPRGVDADEALVLVTALIPNRRGQPMLNEWFVERMGLDGKVRSRLTLEELMEQTGLGRTALPNSGRPFDATRLQSLLAPALQHAREHMATRHREFSAETRARAEAELDQLESLRQQHQQQLTLNFKPGDDALSHLREARRDGEARDIDRLFASYRNWVSQTLELDARPHLTVAAVVIATTQGP